MRSWCVAGLLVSSLSFAAAPKCADRVQSLKSLGEKYDAQARADAAGVVQLSYPSEDSLIDRLESREGWKTRGVRLMANPAAQFLDGQAAVMAKHLAALAKETKVELCVQLEGPVQQKLSLDANPRLVAPLLKIASEVGAMDRATVLASELNKKSKCQGLPKLAEAIAYVAPQDRLHLLLNGAAETLEDCKCPAAEAERIYAVLTLMADVWEARTTCAPLTLGKPGAAPVKFTGAVSDFVAKVAAAGAAGVVLETK